MKRVINFVFYNNGFVLLILFVVLSSGTAMAATNPAVRGSLVSSDEEMVAVDNSYIIKVNLDKFDFKVKITAVEKDDLNYYVSYDLYTIDLVDGIWQKIVKKDVLQVNKEQLDGRDLGLFATEELNEVLQGNIKHLKEVQEIEKTIGESEKVVERTYKGLVGRFMESDELTFKGYDPVIEPPVIVVAVIPEPESPEEVEEVPLEDVIPEEEPEEDDTATSTPEVPPVLDTVAPELVLVGDTVMTLTVNTAYVEAGAVAIDGADGDVTQNISITGVVDTAVIGEYLVTYAVSDHAGNTATVIRTVRVTQPVVEEPPVEEPPEPPSQEPPAETPPEEGAPVAEPL